MNRKNWHCGKQQTSEMRRKKAKSLQHIKMWVTRKEKYPSVGDKMAIRGMPDIQVVTVNDIPQTKAERRLQNVVEAVYKLPKGRGVRVRDTSSYVDPESHSRHILTYGRLLGKPVTTRVRYIGKSAYVFVFKRTDVIKKRFGYETR